MQLLALVEPFAELALFWNYMYWFWWKYHWIDIINREQLNNLGAAFSLHKAKWQLLKINGIASSHQYKISGRHPIVKLVGQGIISGGPWIAPPSHYLNPYFKYWHTGMQRQKVISIHLGGPSKTSSMTISFNTRQTLPEKGCKSCIFAV